MVKQPGFPVGVRAYRTRLGRFPFRDWFFSLRDPETRRRIRARLFRVETGQWGDCRHIAGSIWELRLDFGPGYRVYAAREPGRLILLLVGGQKGTQQRDIAKAGEYYDDYKERGADAIGQLE
jgi:putative addiction module killer protein